VDRRVKALVQFAGGYDPGPLALPSDTADEQDNQEETAPDQLSPPAPGGPWSDARESAAGSADARPGPSEGPWGRHS
jgi:heat shock protein HtpX